MYIIGLTGGIATGKSTVSKMLVSLPQDDGGPIPVVDLDLIARDVVRPGMPGLRDIVMTFGKEVLTEKGELDRPKMGKIVFGDPDARKKINRCTHPYIQRETLRQILGWYISGARLIVVDSPLLFEAKLGVGINLKVVVYCPPEIQLSRLMARDSSTSEAALQRVNAQMPIDEKRALADLVIDNTGGAEDTKRQVCDMVAKRTPGLVATAAWWLVGVGPATVVWGILTVLQWAGL